MNLLDLIARAKSLYATITDPAAGIFTKVRAVLDFLNYIAPILNQPQPSFAGDDVPATLGEAVANLEALATTEGVGATFDADGVGADGRIMKALLAILAKLLPLLI